MSEIGQLITNTEDKSVMITPELEAALPGIADAFGAANEGFTANPHDYLTRLELSQFTVKTSEGPNVACSLLTPESEPTNELLVLFAPFADRNPKTDAEMMSAYISDDVKVSKTDAKPNTWNQITKSAVTADVLEALGHGMPVLTIFAPVPARAYTPAERKQFRAGDFSPAGQLALEVMTGAVAEAQEQLRDTWHPQRFTTLHLAGASLGASNAVGAGIHLYDMGFEVQTVTAQELVLSPRSMPDLAKRFTIGGIVGEASDTPFPETAERIGEAALRQAIDRNGSEIIGMNLRMIQGASKLSYMRGLTRPEPTLEALEKLVIAGTQVLTATADHSAMTDRTPSLLPDGVQHLRLTPQEGEKLGHIVDEFVSVSTLVTALNVVRSRRNQ